MGRKPKKKRNKNRKKNKQERKRNRAMVVVFIDLDGSTVRFERLGAEILFYLEGELTQRFVKILKIDPVKGWVVFRGQKMKSDLMFTADIKTVVEVRPDNKHHVLAEMEMIRHWHGPLTINSPITVGPSRGVLSKFDSKTGFWTATTTTGDDMQLSEREIKLEWSVLEHNCIHRSETDNYGFLDTGDRGMSIYSKQDIPAKKIILKDRSFLFTKWISHENLVHLGISHENLVHSFTSSFGNLFHNLHTQYPSVWEFLQNTLSDSGPEFVSHFSQYGEKLRISLEAKNDLYSDENWTQTFSRTFAILYGNVFETNLNNNLVACVFPIISACNHDCDPNCVLELGENQTGLYAALRTLRPIKEGESLTISYFGTDILSQGLDDRRDYILKHRNFTCLCSKCSREEEIR